LSVTGKICVFLRVLLFLPPIKLTTTIQLKRTGLWLWQTEHIHCHVWHSYSVTVINQLSVVLFIIKWACVPLQSGLCCLIFSVLCNALSTIVFLFVLFIQLLYCLFFYDFKLLIIPLVSSKNVENPIMHVGLVQSIHHHHHQTTQTWQKPWNLETAAEVTT
jgi:hypothetical protein